MTNMRGLILLEGPDGSGKTNLAYAIKDRVLDLRGRARVMRMEKPEEGKSWAAYSSSLVDYIKLAFNDEMVIIADRHFMSEAIRNIVHRQGSEHPYLSRHLDRCLYRFRALQVLCIPPVEYVLKHLKPEEHAQDIEKVTNLFAFLWRGSSSGVANDIGGGYLQQLTNQGGVRERLGWYHYDVTTHGQDIMTYASFLLHELQMEQDLVPEYLYQFDRWRFTGFPHRNAVLLVGDRVSPEVENDLHLPFFINHDSSMYLAMALHQVRADESRVVIANVNDPNGVQTVRILGELCGRTVVMGREAERTLLHEGIPYDAKIRHPQYARRFTHHDTSYQEEMREALCGWAGVR